MTKKTSKQKFRDKRELAEVQVAYLSVHDPKLLKRRAKKVADYNLTLFIPSENVSIRPVGENFHVFVRDGHNGKYGRWRQFHNAQPAVEKLQALPYKGITAPLSAWHGVSLFVANRTMAADLPKELSRGMHARPGATLKKGKQDPTTAAFVAGRQKGKAA